MLPEEFQEYISYIQSFQMETESIEVKSANGGCPSRLYDTLSSFSNKSGGGIIIFGLDESKKFEAVGVYNANDLQKKVVEQCKNMNPVIRPIFTVLKTLNGKILLCAEIPEVRQEDKPCYYTGAGLQKGSYIRVGDADEVMTSYEIYNINAYRNRLQDDLRPVERAELDDLDMEAVHKYIESVKANRPNLSRLEDSKLMEKLGIIVENDGKLYPSLASFLIFGLYPQTFFPQLTVTAVVIPGIQLGETGDLGERFLDNKKIEGTIPQMISQTVDFIVKNMKVRTIIREDDAKRDDKLEYPIPAIREAVINALEHRDYSTYTEGMSIQVRMFNDRIEIQNPGGLYGEVTMDEIISSKKDIRNKNIVRILEDLKVLENRGSGIPTIIREMKELRLEPPIFEEKRGDFWVIFKNYTLLTKQDKEWIKGLEFNLSENEALALSFLRKNGVMTNSDYQKLSNLNRDKSLVEIKDLVNKGILNVQGTGRGTSYKLNEKITVDTRHNTVAPTKMTDHDTVTPTKMTDHDIEVEKDILDFCQTPKAKKEIMEHIGLKHRNNFDVLYLRPLLLNNSLQMTIPKKPKSKNQKYVTVKQD